MNRPRTLLFLLLGASLVFFLIASVLSYRTRPEGLITSDGKAYYAWLRSVALDRDLDFANDYRLIYPPEPLPSEASRQTPRGLVVNKYPVGVALIELPGFAVGHVVATMLGYERNGVTAPYQFAVTLWLQVLCLAALALLWSSAVRLGADPAIAAVVAATALTATNLVHYVARPAMAHAPGLAVSCFALYVSTWLREGNASPRTVAAFGALAGLAVIIRPSNIALYPFFAAVLSSSVRRDARNWLALTAGFAPVIALQVALTSAHWGSLTFVGYTDEGFTAGLGGVLSALVSARHGLFVYHPWYLVTLALVVAAVRDRGSRPLAIGALLSFGAFAVINGTWWAWWFGDSFGNRAFIEVIPALAITAAVYVSSVASRARAMQIALALALLLSAGNALLWSGYVLRRYPADGSHSVGAAYLWPWRS